MEGAADDGSRVALTTTFEVLGSSRPVRLGRSVVVVLLVIDSSSFFITCRPFCFNCIQVVAQGMGIAFEWVVKVNTHIGL
jgi:hypothetical protein